MFHGGNGADGIDGAGVLVEVTTANTGDQGSIADTSFEIFSGIRNDIRETFASRYLLETDMPLEKIADQLGYSDQASFSKAYRSWTGRTPGEVRRTSRP